jgi:hypothetical protein
MDQVSTLERVFSYKAKVTAQHPKFSNFTGK